MKYSKYHSILIITILSLLFTLGTPSGLYSQVKAAEDITEFLIEIKVDGNQVEMKCKKGCAWKELSFNVASGKKSQAIDEYGMVSTPEAAVKEDPKLSNFLITVKITDEGLCLRGREGTEWMNLKLGCPGNNCIKTIDQNGTREVDVKE